MIETPFIQQPHPITVVIATLGGDTLKDTIEHLNRGSVMPAEVLICIPEQEAHRVADLLFSNVKIIVTKCRGQVAQRAAGFQNASYDIVMQLDDDVLVEEDCVACLLQTLIKYRPLTAVAPALIDKGMLGKIIKMNNTMLRIYYFLMNGRDGYQMGTVSRAGAEFGFDSLQIKKGVYDAKWLPGGCVIHFKENLITENFFQYKKKAYCEDLLHSYYLMKNGVRLKIDLNAQCSLRNVTIFSYGIKEFINFIFSDYRIRKYYVKLTSRNYLRMHLYYMALVFNYLIKRLLVKIRK